MPIPVPPDSIRPTLRTAQAIAATLAVVVCATSAALPGSASAATAPSYRPPVTLVDAQTIATRCDAVLAGARIRKSAMERKSTSTGLFDEWNRLSIELEDWFNPVYLLASVSPDPQVRDAADQCTNKLTPFTTELFQSEPLYRRVLRARPSDPVQSQLRRDLLDGFEDSGIALPPAQRARVKAINERLAVLEQEFAKNLRDDPTRLTFEPALMDGMPESYLKSRTRDAAGNYVLDLSYPSYLPYLQLAKSEAGRKRYWIAKQNEGGDANLRLLDEAVGLRKELASLYGLPDFATFQLRRRMAGTPAAVERFLDKVIATVAPIQARELDELRALKARSAGAAPEAVKLERWDVSYYQEQLRQARYSIDQEALRKYFPTDKSVQYALRLAETLYSVRFVETKVPVWHPDVRHYEVHDALPDGRPGKFRADIYLDLYPRPGKYNHAAAFPIRGASRLVGRTPASALVANLNNEGLNHDELETMLHEFGHVLHGTLSTARYVDQAGTSVKRDFVEAPSQMFEEWARREPALALFAAVCPECPRLSSEQIGKLDSARKFGHGNLFATQWLYAAFDMALAGPTPKPALDTWAELQSKTPLGYVQGTKFPAGFGHLLGGYAAGYYGYMWSQVIALDMLSAFDGRMLDPKVGARYRDTILARGGERPPSELVETFLGRQPNERAFLKEIAGER